MIKKWSDTYSTFIITYKRNEDLKETICTLLDQSHAPRLIMIIDNDPEFHANIIAEEFSEKGGTVEYRAMGYNAGPAGAAREGLKVLSEKGYDWIQWIDDDDPPRFPEVNERLFELIPEELRKEAGILTPSGNDFSLRRGRSIRYSNEDLKVNEFLCPKTVGGNQGMMISAKVVEAGCLPMGELFFGFEELDFCLQVRRAGFKIIAPTALYRQYRKGAGRWHLTETDRWEQSLRTPAWRMYYSVRNLIYILHYRTGNRTAALRVALRSFAKSVLYDVFKLEFNRIPLTIRATFDAYRKKLGNTVRPDA